jgi:tetratricopeptide (TPR) repeat protein
LSAQRGDPTSARARYLESLEIRRRLGDEAGEAALTNNLGIVAQQQGDLTQARELGERALELYTRLGDPRRISSCEINLAWMDGMAGRHDEALGHGQEAIRLALEVGDRLNRAIAENNMGDALRDLGRLDDAGAAYGAAVETYRDLGDRGPLMALFEDIAVLMALRSKAADAFTLVGASDGLRAVLGSPRGDDAEAALMERLAAARAAIGDGAADRARQSGAVLSLDDAIALALASARGSGPGPGQTAH